MTFFKVVGNLALVLQVGQWENSQSSKVGLIAEILEGYLTSQFLL
jgi:hypothetical protein